MSKILILSGGGAKGAFQAGVYQRFMEEGWRPDVVAGISVGALNGAMIATGMEHRMSTVWENIEPKKVLKKNGVVNSTKKAISHELVGIGTDLIGDRLAPVKRVLNMSPFLRGKMKQLTDKIKSRFNRNGGPPLGYYNNKPLRNLITENIGARFVMDYYCGSVNMHTLEYHTHHARKLNVPWSFIDEILASTAIPLVFNPVQIDGDLHVDGGVRHMSPLKKILQDNDPTEIRIILCSRYRGYTAVDQGEVRNVLDLSKRTLDTLLNEIFMKDLKEFERINRLVAQAHDEGWELKKRNGRPYKKYTTYLYEPTQSLGDSLNFRKEQARENIEHGRNVEPIKL